MTQNEEIYYVYQLRDELEEAPFYIGKGKEID